MSRTDAPQHSKPNASHTRWPLCFGTPKDSPPAGWLRKAAAGCRTPRRVARQVPLHEKPISLPCSVISPPVSVVRAGHRGVLPARAVVSSLSGVVLPMRSTGSVAASVVLKARSVVLRVASVVLSATSVVHAGHRVILQVVSVVLPGHQVVLPGHQVVFARRCIVFRKHTDRVICDTVMGREAGSTWAVRRSLRESLA